MRRLIKGVRIARSGIYEYRLGELQSMELAAPMDNIKDVYKVYRPALILSENVGKFKDLPLLFDSNYHTHPENYEDQNNWKRYGIGYTGSTPEIMWEGDEVSIISHLTIIDREGFNAYNAGIVEVSPGYYGNFIWKDGITDKGETYDIVMIGIETVDHLIMTSKARGGHTCKILDSQGGITMPKVLSGLLWQLRKMFNIGVGDTEMASFRSIVSDIMMNRNNLSEEDFANKMGSLKSIIIDLPDTTDKGLLGRYIDELPVYKQKPDDLAIRAGDSIASLFERLDKDALKDVPIIIESPVADAEKQKAPDEEKSTEGEKKEGKEDVLEPIKEEHENLEPIKKENLEAIKPEGDCNDAVYDQETANKEEQALNGATTQIGQQSPDYILNEIHGLLSKWKSGQSPQSVSDAPLTTVTKNTEYRSDNLEQKQTGSDKVLDLETQKTDKSFKGFKSSAGDAEINNSVIMDDSATDTTDKKGFIEIFNEFKRR